MNITRTDFLKRLLRLILVTLLTGLAVILGNRIVYGNNCSVCPGKGFCKGEIDCDKYLKAKK